jgi:hypothetical protein
MFGPRGQELLSCMRGAEEFVGGDHSPLAGAQYRTLTAKLTSAVSGRSLKRKTAVHQLSRTHECALSPPALRLEHFFDLSDLFLNFAGVFFCVAFGL